MRLNRTSGWWYPKFRFFSPTDGFYQWRIFHPSVRWVVIFIFVAFTLSACVTSNPTTDVLPSSTAFQFPTGTQKSASKVIPSETPSPNSQIFADFPLVKGTIWKYSAEISYQDPNDYSKLVTWTGLIIDKVIDKKITPDGKIIFIVQEDFEPLPPKDVWRQPRTFEYMVSGNSVFEGSMKIYQWPLEDNMKWKTFSDFEYEMIAQHVGEVNTPFRKLNNCFVFIIATNPDTSMETFCTGIGFVKHSYRHHGTPQNEKFVLSAFTLGQP